MWLFVELVLLGTGSLSYQGLVKAAGIGKEQAAHKVFATMCLKGAIVKAQ